MLSLPTTSQSSSQDLGTAKQPADNKEKFSDVASSQSTDNGNDEEPKQAKAQLEDLTKALQIPLPRRRTMLRRFIYRRIYRGRMLLGCGKRSLGFSLHQSPSCNSFYSAASVHTVHSARSGISLQSQHAGVFNLEWERVSTGSFVQTDMVCTVEEEVQVTADCCEQEVQARPETTECGSQADVSVEQRMLLMPLRTRCFVNLVQNAVDTGFDLAGFRARLIQLWEGDENFRENIERMQDMWTEKQPPGWVESYEGFVAVLGCVRSLKLAVIPASSALLEEIEQRINARMVLFHNQKMDSELYCTVFYPVERRHSVFFNVSK